MRFVTSVSYPFRRSTFCWFFLLFALNGCGRSATENPAILTEAETFRASLRGICNVIQNFNDLICKSPTEEAWVGYAELVSRKVTDCINIKSDNLDSNLKEQLIQLDDQLKEVVTAKNDKRIQIQAGIYRQQKDWIKKYNL